MDRRVDVEPEIDDSLVEVTEEPVAEETAEVDEEEEEEEEEEEMSIVDRPRPSNDPAELQKAVDEALE